MVNLTDQLNMTIAVFNEHNATKHAQCFSSIISVKFNKVFKIHCNICFLLVTGDTETMNN